MMGQSGFKVPCERGVEVQTKGKKRPHGAFLMDDTSSTKTCQYNLTKWQEVLYQFCHHVIVSCSSHHSTSTVDQEYI